MKINCKNRQTNMDDKEEAILKEEFDVISGLPVVGLDEISKPVSPFVIKTEPNDDELITEGVDEISQTISIAVIKAESKDNELPEVYGQMISQQPDQIVIKAEHLNDELPAVCENVICQTTLPIFIKTEPKDEEQHFGFLENLVHRNNLHYETPDSQPPVVIETKPLDELYGHEFSSEQSCEVQSGECDVQTIPKRKKKSTVHNRSAELKGQGIKPQNVSSHMGLHKQQCDICNRTFKFIKNLEIHMQSHDLKSHVALTQKTCEICHKTLAPKSFANHMRKHELLPFRCTRCPRLFPSNDILESHRKDCERKKPLVCQICQLGFSLESSLRQHLNAFHNIVNKYMYSCPFCSKLFRRKTNMLEHTKNHTQPDVIKIKCSVCTDTFIGMDCFNDHFETHDTAKDFVWCDFCKEHVLLSNYETHLQNHHKCQVCSKRFKRVELLRNHEAHCDNVEDMYQCYICLKSFKTKEILNAHKSNHLETKVFQCWVCNEKFTRHYALHSHFYKHKENLPMKCNVCSRKISWTDASNHFIKWEKFECGVCNKKFTTHSILHRHFYSHKENLPMKCNVCSRKISWTDASNYFIKWEKFVCGVCNKKFTTHSILHMHFYSHKENLPMKCNVCSREISCTDALNYKIKREKFVCGVCNKKFTNHSRLHEHFYSHKENLPSKCNVCSREIKWTDPSNYYMRKEKFVCGVCNKKFSSHAILHNHFYTHKEDLTIITIKCTFCRRQFSITDANRQKLKRRKFYCPRCPATFRSKQDLSVHSYAHYQTCEICGKVSKSMKLHEIHFRSHVIYTIRLPYSCKHCTKRFKNLHRLQLHRCSRELQVDIKCLGNSKTLSTAGLLDNQTSEHLSNNSGLNLPTVNEPLILKTSASNTLLKNVPILPTMGESNISRGNEINISEEHVISTANATCSTEVNVCDNPTASACNISTISAGNISSMSADNMLLVRECNIPLVSAYEVPEVSNCNIPRAEACTFPPMSACIITTVSASNISTINEHPYKPLQNATSLSNFQSLNTAFNEKPMVHQPATSSQQIDQKMKRDGGVGEENEDTNCTSSVNEHNLNKEQAQKDCGSELLYTCKVCQKMFKYPLDLKNHIREHKKVKMNKRSFKC